MKQELLTKLDELSKILQLRKNDSYSYFRDTKNSIMNNENIKDDLKHLVRCYAITQYANFNNAEEILLSEIIALAREELSNLDK
ncbi:MAG: hypothetical protein E6Q66_10495 [Pedobacter sp.]|nr:MAG: hypothetical protein E6Q66_10495 [Pedobacter sp.]